MATINAVFGNCKEIFNSGMERLAWLFKNMAFSVMTNYMLFLKMFSFQFKSNYIKLRIYHNGLIRQVVRFGKI